MATKQTKQEKQGKQILNLVKQIQDDRKIQREIIFSGIQETLRHLLDRHFEGKYTEDLHVSVNQNTGILKARRHKEDIDHELLYKLITDSKKDLMLTITGRQIVEMANQMQEQRKIPRELILGSIEEALGLAIQKFYGLLETDETDVHIDPLSGIISAKHGDELIDPELLGRIAAQSAKQSLIQKFREAESQATFDQYAAQKGDLVRGQVQRIDKGSGIVQLERARSEALLPRSEQIPGETLNELDRVEAVILDVRKNGHRVKIVLSRTHPELVRRLFEREIPEIKEKIIEVKAVSREAGYRSKVAVSSIDVKVDCVGACVGVRGSRIKNIVDALGGNERIDIVRWNDSLQVLIPNALQPATIEEVFLYPRLGRAIVLVQEDQLSLAIGRRGQNVRLASKLVGWDIEIMTHDELDEGIGRAEGWFTELPGISTEGVEVLLEEGFLSFDDLTFMETFDLAELIGVTEEQAAVIVEHAELAAERVEEEQRLRAELEQQAAEEAAAAGVEMEAPAVVSPAEQLLGEATQQETGQTEPTRTFESLFREDQSATVEEMPDGAIVPSDEAPADATVEDGSEPGDVAEEEETAPESIEPDAIASDVIEQDAPVIEDDEDAVAKPVESVSDEAPASVEAEEDNPEEDKQES